MSNKKLTSYKDWVIKETEEGMYSQDALRQYDTGVNNDITLDAEDENGVYGTYLEKLEARIERHEDAYEDHLSGNLPTDQFIRDIEITKRLMEDFMAYQDRFIKAATSSQKKNR